MTNDPEWVQLWKYTREFTHQVGHKWWNSLTRGQQQAAIDNIENFKDGDLLPGALDYIKWRKRIAKQ